jgi:hypothetical protein
MRGHFHKVVRNTVARIAASSEKDDVTDGRLIPFPVASTIRKSPGPMESSPAVDT